MPFFKDKKPVFSFFFFFLSSICVCFREKTDSLEGAVIPPEGSNQHIISFKYEIDPIVIAGLVVQLLFPFYSLLLD